MTSGRIEINSLNFTSYQQQNLAKIRNSYIFIASVICLLLVILVAI